MRRKVCLMVMWIMFTMGIGGAGAQYRTESGMAVAPLPIWISHMKTTNLVFPLPVISIDRGSKAVLAQKASGVDNVVQVKAASDSMKETNLTAITSDGALYSFLLQYAERPRELNVLVGRGDEAVPVGLLEPGRLNESVIEQRAGYVSGARRFMRIRDKSGGVSLLIEGMYTDGEHLYIPLAVYNDSGVRYHIDQLRFFIKDKKVSRRTAVQEVRQEPVFVQHAPSFVYEQSSARAVYVLPKFTVPDQKILVLQVMEKSGGRHLEITIGNKSILRARSVKF